MLIWATLAHAHIPILYTFGPTDDWCGFLNQTADVGGETFYPGDVILLDPGEYGPCAFTAPVTDNDSEFTVIQSRDALDPAVFVHDGGEAMLDLTGVQVFLLGLRFEGVPAGSAAVRLRDVHNVWTRFGTFAGVEGDGIRVEGDATAIWILDDRFAGPGTSVRLGCPGCAQDVKVRNGLFAGGTGVRAASGVTLEASDLVFDGGDLGVRLEGGAGTSFVTANLFAGTAVAIDVGGGPVIVRNNAVAAGQDALLAREDGGAWTGVRVLGNSFAAGAVTLEGFADGTFEVVDNGALGDLGPGNVDCTGQPCWRDPAAWDFHAPVGSPLREAGSGARDDALFEDFCGQQRESPSTAGAVQVWDAEGWAPFELDVFKNDFPCVLEAPPVEDTGIADTDEVTGRACGCAGGGAPPAPTALLALLLLRRRR